MKKKSKALKDAQRAAKKSMKKALKWAKKQGMEKCSKTDLVWTCILSQTGDQGRCDEWAKN